MDYKKFYEYFKDLYGTGLEVANWHLNGNTEPFDNFFDSAVEFALESEEPKKVSIMSGILI